jgi:non-ribosomal peptide synthetase component E (peptide arylation enzyme)
MFCQHNICGIILHQTSVLIFTDMNTWIVCCFRLACQCAADVTAMTDTQRQALLNTYLSPESIRACTIRFDSTGFEEDALKNKSVSDDSVCHVSKAVVSVCGIQLPVFNSTSQVCINSVGCVCKHVISL